MSIEQNSPQTTGNERPETWDGDSLDAQTVVPAPEHRDDKHEKNGASSKNRVIATIAGLGLAVTAGGVGYRLANNEGKAPAPKAPEASAPVTPGESVNEPVATPEQELRDSMTYTTEYEYFVDPKYYTEVEQYGGIDAEKEESYINDTYVAELIQSKLNNITTALETGNQDAVLASYKQVTPGEYGELSGTVETLTQQAELKQEFQEQNPSYPVSSMYLTGISDIVPDPTNKNVVEVYFTIDHTDYGNYRQGQDVVKFRSIQDMAWVLEREEVGGWSDGGTRTNWSIQREFLLDSNEVNE